MNPIYGIEQLKNPRPSDLFDRVYAEYRKHKPICGCQVLITNISERPTIGGFEGAIPRYKDGALDE